MNSKCKLLQTKRSLVQIFPILKAHAIFMTPLHDNLERLFPCRLLTDDVKMRHDWGLVSHCLVNYPVYVKCYGAGMVMLC